MAIQLGTNLLSGGGGGAGVPINSYGAFNSATSETLFVDNTGSVWLQTGTSMHVTGTGDVNDAQIYIDQGAQTLGALSLDSTFGTSGTSVEIATFNSVSLGTGFRSVSIHYDGINDQYILFNSLGNTTNSRYVTLNLAGTNHGAIVDAGTNLLGGSVGDGTTDYAIYTTACSAADAGQIFSVSGTYPYTSTLAQTMDPLPSASGGNRALLLSDSHFLIFNSHSSSHTDIALVDRTTGAVTEQTLPHAYAGMWQESGQTDVFWAALANPNQTVGAQTKPNYIHQYRHTFTGPVLTGITLDIEGDVFWHGSDGVMAGMNPNNEDVVHVLDTGFNTRLQRLNNPGIGDHIESYTNLENAGGTNFTRVLRNYIKIGNQ